MDMKKLKKFMGLEDDLTAPAIPQPPITPEELEKAIPDEAFNNYVKSKQEISYPDTITKEAELIERDNAQKALKKKLLDKRFPNIPDSKPFIDTDPVRDIDISKFQKGTKKQMRKAVDKKNVAIDAAERLAAQTAERKAAPIAAARQMAKSSALKKLMGLGGVAALGASALNPLSAAADILAPDNIDQPRFNDNEFTPAMDAQGRAIPGMYQQEGTSELVDEDTLKKLRERK